MKPFVCLLSYLIVVLESGCASASPPYVTVKPQGETSIATMVGKRTVLIEIKTHELQIGKPSDGRPSVIQSSCTYSRYPCSLVDRIAIAVDGSDLFVPRSAFCDLADLTRAEVEAGESTVVLTLYGGDASESYIVKIEFDSDNVKQRIFSNAISPHQPLQETTYHLQVLGG